MKRKQRKEQAMKTNVEKTGAVAGLVCAACGLILAVFKVKETFTKK